jgi:CRISPR-associated protein Csd1
LSWFSSLVETYDRCRDIAGIADERGNTLLPSHHMMKKTDICVTLGGDGGFRKAEPSILTIMIPCTEKSASRTSGIAEHPLHEDLNYLIRNKEKQGKYLALLAKWSDKHPKLAAVRQYVDGKTLLDDLRSSGIKLDSDKTDAREKKKEQEKLDKQFVRFRVEIPGDLTPNLWEDAGIAEAWITCCNAAPAAETTLCYATGELAVPVTTHPKGVNPAANSAKLISCNDETNYTYRGRFNKPEQASAVSAGASHKAHAMLKYLIATQGYQCATQAVAAWAVDDGGALPSPFEDSLSLYATQLKTDREKLIAARGELDADYAHTLRQALSGKDRAGKLRNTARRVAVIATDAASTGRMGITFYQSLSENDYIDRVIKWHESCCWHFHLDRQRFIVAPSADRIIAAVYGEPRGEEYKKIQKQAREKLLHCVVCGEALDRGWIAAAVARVSAPFSYSRQDGGWDKAAWDNALNTTCAMVRQHYYHQKEEFALELEKTRTDRSYLFGRLLALAEQIESHARYLQFDGEDPDKRPTNAVRYMTAFAAKPVRTWKIIVDQLNPYIQRLNGAEGYQRQIDEIMCLFAPDAFVDSPLDGQYLLGYSLQRRELYRKKGALNNDPVDDSSNNFSDDSSNDKGEMTNVKP